MRIEWETRALGQVCTIKPPKSEARARLTPGESVSFLPMEGLGINRKFVCGSQTKPLSAVSGSYTYFADGDVLLAKITPCFENGKLGIASGLTNGIGFGSSEYVVFRPSASLSKEWLYYFLSRESFREEGAASMAGAVGHKRVAKEFIESYPIPVPPLPEQRRIVAILDGAFEGIATAKANFEKNFQNARAIFESHLDAAFRQSGDDWVDKSMGELVADGALAKPFDGNHGEIHPRKADFQKAGVPFVMASDLHDGEVDTRHCAFLSRKQADSLRVGFAKDGDVLISHKGTIGRSAIVKTTDDYIMLTPQVTAYRVSDFGKLYNRYIRYFFMSHAFQQKMLAGAADGSTRAYIGITKQLSLRLRFPSVERQMTIANQLDVLLLETQRLANIYEKKLIALDALKESILHRALSGELTAKTGPDLVEAAA
jgi:type I restriction enzyme S subunit